MPGNFLKIGQAALMGNPMEIMMDHLLAQILLWERFIYFLQETWLQKAKSEEWSQRACLFRNVGRTLCSNDLPDFDHKTLVSENIDAENLKGMIFFFKGKTKRSQLKIQTFTALWKPGLFSDQIVTKRMKSIGLLVMILFGCHMSTDDSFAEQTELLKWCTKVLLNLKTCFHCHVYLEWCGR